MSGFHGKVLYCDALRDTEGVIVLPAVVTAKALHRSTCGCLLRLSSNWAHCCVGAFGHWHIAQPHNIVV